MLLKKTHRESKELQGTYVDGILLVLLDTSSKVLLELSNDGEVTGSSCQRRCEGKLLSLGVLDLKFRRVLVMCVSHTQMPGDLEKRFLMECCTYNCQTGNSCTTGGSNQLVVRSYRNASVDKIQKLLLCCQERQPINGGLADDVLHFGKTGLLPSLYVDISLDTICQGLGSNATVSIVEVATKVRPLHWLTSYTGNEERKEHRDGFHCDCREALGVKELARNS